MYDLLLVDSQGSPSSLQSWENFTKVHPLPSWASSELLDVAWGAAEAVKNTFADKRPSSEYLWIFELTSRLKGAIPEDARLDPDVGKHLAPIALFFVDALEHLGCLPPAGGRIAWDDADAILIEFEEAWAKRLFPKGSAVLELAAAVAISKPLPLTGNPHLIRVLTLAHYLQTRQPGLPIIIPVNRHLASLLGTTPVTLGTSISKAVRDGYLQIEDNRYNARSRRARTFRMNLDHPYLVKALEQQALTAARNEENGILRRMADTAEVASSEDTGR